MKALLTGGCRIEVDPRAIGGQVIICLTCGTKSYSPEDVRNRFCGFCNAYHPDEGSDSAPEA